MKTTVYLETTIPSFLYETRKLPEFAAMQKWTQEWWDSKDSRHDCFTSIATEEELKEGDYPFKAEKLLLLDGIPQLPVTVEIEEIVQVYLANHLMPKDVLGDALHLAVASFHKMDYLLTWNCNHLANANKKRHIRRINERLRIPTPDIVTPRELGTTRA